MSLPLELPIEIIYNIIDLLGCRHPQTGIYEKETLKSCSLISRACVEVAQKHIFHSITIQLRHMLRLCILHHILQVNTSIGTYVRELILLDVGPDVHRVYQEPNDDTFDLTLERLPRVQRLEILSWAVDLERFDWDALRRSTQLALEHIIESEKFVALRLSFTRMWPLSVLAMSPGLRCLDLDFSELYDDVSRADGPPPTSPLRLSCLKTSKSSRAILMLWNLAIQSQQSLIDFSVLDELQFSFYGEEDIRIFGQLMTLVGPNLRRLKLVIATEFDEMPPLFVASMNASRLENLEYLEFDIGDEDYIINGAVVNAISELNRSFKLLEIKIMMLNVYCVLGEEIQIAEYPVWRNLDVTLARTNLCSLRILTLDIALPRRLEEPGYRSTSSRQSAPSVGSVKGLIKQKITKQFENMCALVHLVINLEVYE